MTPLLILVGPTGVGKTAVAIELCDLLDGEIVSADSMQIYCGLDIGTAKATPAERQRAPHHLVDIVNAIQPYSAAQWAVDARKAITDIRARGKTPIICGGTGFYIRALLEPETLADAVPDVQLREELEAAADAQGAGYLHQQLQQRDAAAAERLHPNDVRRVIRALEVAEQKNRHLERVQQGKTSPAIENDEDAPNSRFEPHVWALSLERATLYARLDARNEAMLAAGFMGELCALLHGAPESNALQSIGYKQMRPALRHAEKTEECLELWKRDTRRYAKRQMTWFRNQLDARWIEMNTLTSREAAELITCEWRPIIAARTEL